MSNPLFNPDEWKFIDSRTKNGPINKGILYEQNSEHKFQRRKGIYTDEMMKRFKPEILPKIYDNLVAKYPNLGLEMRDLNEVELKDLCNHSMSVRYSYFNEIGTLKGSNALIDILATICTKNAIQKLEDLRLYTARGLVQGGPRKNISGEMIFITDRSTMNLREFGETDPLKTLGHITETPKAKLDDFLRW